jgi:hypothetical protein
MTTPTIASTYQSAMNAASCEAGALTYKKQRVETLLDTLRVLLPYGVRIEGRGALERTGKPGDWFHVVLTAERRNSREDIVLTRPVASLESSADLTEEELRRIVGRPRFAREVRYLEGVVAKTREHDAMLGRWGLGLLLAALIAAVTFACVAC